MIFDTITALIVGAFLLLVGLLHMGQILLQEEEVNIPVSTGPYFLRKSFLLPSILSILKQIFRFLLGLFYFLLGVALLGYAGWQFVFSFNHS